MTTTAPPPGAQSREQSVLHIPDRIGHRLLAEAVEQPNGCMTLPHRSLDPQGYAYVGWRDETGRHATTAYRATWVAQNGQQVPPGHDLDHTCHTLSGCTRTGLDCQHRACINPAHLEPVTHEENVRRGNAGLRNRTVTHCPKGHSYSGSNLKLNAGRRTCRECQNQANREYRARNARLAVSA